VEEIFQTFLTATKEELKGAEDKLKDMTPPPMNALLEKESRSSAMKKKLTGVSRQQKMYPLPHQVSAATF